jgi:hypothetical protein
MKTIKQEKPAQGVVVPKKNEKKEFIYLRKSEKDASKKATNLKVKPKKMMKAGGSIKKAQDGTKFAALAPPFDKATYADKIAGATKNKAKSGTKVKKAMMGAMAKPMMKSGGKMKTCKGGC